MSIDIYAKSSQLLERIANSMYDRDPNTKAFFFTTSEIHVTETWLKELLLEIEEVKNPGEANPGEKQLQEVNNKKEDKL